MFIGVGYVCVNEPRRSFLEGLIMLDMKFHIQVLFSFKFLDCLQPIFLGWEEKVHCHFHSLIKSNILN